MEGREGTEGRRRWGAGERMTFFLKVRWLD